jgi:hypothetical protein
MTVVRFWLLVALGVAAVCAIEAAVIASVAREVGAELRATPDRPPAPVPEAALAHFLEQA